MPEISTIRLTSYDVGRLPWSRGFKVIAFERAWREAVNGLFTRSSVARTTPVSNFNALLHAALPDVLAAPGAAVDDRVPWLYAAEPVPVELLNRLAGVWAAKLLRRGDADDAVEAVLDALESAVPEWGEIEVDLTSARLSQGGTALPDDRLYHLLPEAVAARLVTTPYLQDGVELSFRAVPSTRGVTLVSWPPQAREIGRRTWHDSLMVRVALATVPFSERPRMHITSGVRRWETGDPVKLEPQRGATVFLDVPFPWSGGPEAVPRLVPNRIHLDGGGPVWARYSLAELLPEYSSSFALPSAAEVLEDPQEWARGRGGVSAWLVHRTGFAAHRVKAGLMPVERRHVDEWVEQALDGVLLRSADMRKATVIAKPELRKRVKPDPEAKARDAEQRGVARRRACAVALGGAPLVVQIRYENERTRDALLTALHELLSLAPDDGLEWSTPEIEVRVDCATWADIAGDLPVGRLFGAERRKARAAAYRERRKAIAAHFGTDGEDARHRLVLVELRGQDKFGPDRDPKEAIRLGCAAAGRVTQFITTEEDALPDRARSAVLDGLRQLGAVMPPRHAVGAVIPAGTQFVGVWMVRKNRSTARTARRSLVVVRVRPGEHGQRVEGWDERRKTWVDYPDLLLSLAADHNSGRGRWLSREEEQAAVEERLRALLFQLRGTPTLLLVEAGNLRSSWPWLTNSAAQRDRIGFVGKPVQQAALFGPDLRVVVLRDDDEEVPQWYGLRDDEKLAGHASGVWEALDAGPDNRVFASLTAVPTQGARPNQARKYGMTASGQTKSGWNPVYRELTVLACRMTSAGEPEDPKLWAALTHQLRHADDYVPLAKPLVLHLAHKAEEYVLSPKLAVLGKEEVDEEEDLEISLREIEQMIESDAPTD